MQSIVYLVTKGTVGLIINVVKDDDFGERLCYVVSSSNIPFIGLMQTSNQWQQFTAVMP